MVRSEQDFAKLSLGNNNPISHMEANTNNTLTANCNHTNADEEESNLLRKIRSSTTPNFKPDFIKNL